MSYQDFIAQKSIDFVGQSVGTPFLPDSLFPHQRALVEWACKKGRAAIFADTGLGKSVMQICFAESIVRNGHGRVLILAPLAVAAQTSAEGQRIGVRVKVVREPSEIEESGIFITNYDRLHKFDCSAFAGVVLDESSIIKHHEAKTLKTLLDAFRNTPFKLCATATPAPNDWMELGNHAEFLGVRTRAEMLAEFFIHDGGETQKWRLKGHAQSVFWRWVAQWGAVIGSPDDLGFDGSAYQLPPLNTYEHVIDALFVAKDQLFPTQARTLMERRQARRGSMESRVSDCIDLVNSDDAPWVVWCDLNDEGDALEKGIYGAVQIKGSDTVEQKESALSDFAAGKYRVLVSKTKICGFGLNWQFCNRMAFVGVNDSFESYYQAIRRCWRFGQKRPVDVHLFYSEGEGAVLENLKRKEAAAKSMNANLRELTRFIVMQEVLHTKRERNRHQSQKTPIPFFLKAAS